MHITAALSDAPRLPIGISTDTKAGHFALHMHACSRAPMPHQHAHARPMQLQLQLGHRGPWVPRAWLPWNKNKNQPSEQRGLGPGFVCSLEHLLLLLFKTVHERGFGGSAPSTTCMCEDKGYCMERGSRRGGSGGNTQVRVAVWKGIAEGGVWGGTPQCGVLDGKG